MPLWRVVAEVAPLRHVLAVLARYLRERLVPCNWLEAVLPAFVIDEGMDLLLERGNGDLRLLLRCSRSCAAAGFGGSAGEEQGDDDGDNGYMKRVLHKNKSVF